MDTCIVSNSFRNNHLGYHTLSYGVRSSKPLPSRFQILVCDHVLDGLKSDESRKVKNRDFKASHPTKRLGHHASKVHGLGLWHLASSVWHFIASKIKANCQGFLGDVASNDLSLGGEANMIEPYFSIPILVPSAASLHA